MRKLTPGMDPHSWFTTDQPRTTHLDWDVRVDFEAHVLKSTAIWTFDKAGRVELDTSDLAVFSVRDSTTGADIQYDADSPDKIPGSRLAFTVPDSRQVAIRYATSHTASGLQWFDAKPGCMPGLITQFEPIHARSALPCQDSPAVKFTAMVRVTIPSEVRGLVAANHDLGRIDNGNGTATETWKRDRKYPAYLLSILVGDYSYRHYDDRCGVWALPEMLDRVHEEFVSIPAIIAAAEKQFRRKMPSGRFTPAVLPNSFPYGGMEHPVLTNLSPLVVAGDKGAIRVVVHELVHDWLGNLVTNASWADMWLNEGWTVWGEERLMEVLEGVARRDMYRTGEMLGLDRALKVKYDKGWASKTRLCSDLVGLHPDEVFDQVPYGKGSAFIWLLEETVGREAFDEFVQLYLDTFSGKSLSSNDFLDFADAHLPAGTLAKVKAHRWVHGDGLPDNAPKPASPLVDAVMPYATAGTVPPLEVGSHWVGGQWGIYFYYLKDRKPPVETLQELDRNFGFTTAVDPNRRASFCVLAVESGHPRFVATAVTDFLTTYGNLGHATRLFREMCKAGPEGVTLAREIFAKARPTYHPITVGFVLRAMRDQGVEI